MPRPRSFRARWPLALLAALAVAPVRAAEPLRLGLAAPLSGPDAGFGQGLRAGAEQAVAEINRAGGAGGRKLALTVLDDAGEAKQGLAVARQFASAGIGVVIGHLNAGVAAATLAIYEEAGILALNPGSSYPPLTRRGAWLFRLAGTDAAQGRIAGAYLAEQFGERPVAIVNDHTSFGRGLADEAARELKARGGREALFEGIGRGDKDFGSLVAKLRAARVAAVYFGGLATEAALLVRAMREAGVTAAFVGSDGLIDKDFAVLAGAAAEGVAMTLTPEARRPPEPKAARPARPSEPTRAAEAEMFAGAGYAAVEIVRQTVEAARSGEARRLAETLRTGRSARTILGEIAFDAEGERNPQPYRIVTWRRTPDGRIDYLGEAGR